MNDKYTKEILQEAVATSVSMAEVLRKLSLAQSGGNHSHITKKIANFCIDTSHFLGKGANSGARHKGGVKRQNYLVLRDPSDWYVTGTKLSIAMIERGREYACEWCGLKNMWNGRRITLEVDHINGKHYDNRLSNLRFLCPNCHAQRTGKYNR